MLKIVVLLGGKSPERDVSLVSGAEVAKELRLQGNVVFEIDPAAFSRGSDMLNAISSTGADVVFNGLHGGDGENGIIQAMLAQSGFRSTGSDFKASSIAMDKLISKLLAMKAGVPVPRYWICDKSDFQNLPPAFSDVCHEIYHKEENTRLVIKPVDAGSSVGISIINSDAEWLPAMEEAFRYAERVIVEAFVEGKELTVTVLAGKALPVVEIRPVNGWYDYKSKYTKGETEYISPDTLTAEETAKVQHYALKVWQIMQCSGYARIDFRYNGTYFYFLEVNTLPGMTPLSLTPMAAKAIGMTFGDLLKEIINQALI